MLDIPTYTDVRNYVDPVIAPREVVELRRSSANVYRYQGTPVLLKKRYTYEDVDNGIAQASPMFDSTFEQSTYQNDVLSYGVGFVSVETQPGEWWGVEPNDDTATPIIIESPTQPYENFLPAPKYRGYGPGFLTYAIIPDKPEDQWKLSEQGALLRMQTPTVKLPFWPPIGDNDLIITVGLDETNRIRETYEYYTLRQMSPITMHGLDSRGFREYQYENGNGNRWMIGYEGEVTRLPSEDIRTHVDWDR